MLAVRRTLSFLCLAALLHTAALSSQTALSQTSLPQTSLPQTSSPRAPSPIGEGWPTYGGDPGGQRYTGAAQITPANVQQLRPAWVYHTHALESGNHNAARADFEATPVLDGHTLFFPTPFDRVIALDATSGKERWSYDPHLSPDVPASNYTSRGVASVAQSSLASASNAACAGTHLSSPLLTHASSPLDAALRKALRRLRQSPAQVDLKRRHPHSALTAPYRLYRQHLASPPSSAMSSSSAQPSAITRQST